MEKINNNEMQVNDNFNINENRDMFYDMLKTEELCHEYNNIPASQVEKRMDFLKKMFKKADGQFLVFSPFKCAVGYNIEMLGRNEWHWISFGKIPSII